MSFACWNHIQNHLYPIIANSGRAIGRMGNYIGCIQSEDMDYYLINIQYTKRPDVMYPPLSVCLPEQCSTDSVKNLLQMLIDREKLPFAVLSVKNKIYEYSYPFDWVFFVTLFILISLVLLVVITSIDKNLRSHKTLSAFSVQNSMKIFKHHDNRLNTLNGVRSLSMLWVIFGHSYSFGLGGASNIITVQRKLQGWFYLIVEAGLFSVDTFFFIGGFLVAYAVLKQANMSPLKYPFAILNRYLRIVPAFFVAILFFYSIFPHLGSGPKWLGIGDAVKPCDNMWRQLLFISNLLNSMEGLCLGWSWYLQNDMQLFIYSMFLLLVYSKNKFAGYMGVVLSCLFSFYFVMVKCFNQEFHNMNHFSDGATNAVYMSEIYIKPWGRAPPYLYGLLLGILYTNFLQEEKNEDSEYMLVKLKKKVIESRAIRVSIEMAGVLLGCFLIFIQRTNQNDMYWPQYVHSLYLTYAKTLFVVAVSLIVLPSLLGADSMVRFIMDTKFFNFVAKVSYCTYLVHAMFIFQWLQQMKVDTYYDVPTNYDLFVSQSVLSILGGFLLALLVEIPCAKLQKHFMTSLIKKSEKKLKVKKNAQIEEEKHEEKHEEKLEEKIEEKSVQEKELEVSNVRLNETVKME